MPQEQRGASVLATAKAYRSGITQCRIFAAPSGVEHNLAKVGVEGSNPFARSKICNDINCFYYKRARCASTFSLRKHPGNTVTPIQFQKKAPASRGLTAKKPLSLETPIGDEEQPPRRLN